jgi:hypothetical protein
VATKASTGASDQQAARVAVAVAAPPRSNSRRDPSRAGWLSSDWKFGSMTGSTWKGRKSQKKTDVTATADPQPSRTSSRP